MHSSEVNSPLTLTDIVSIIRRYRGRFWTVALLVFAAGTTFIFLLPRKYESEAKLFVRLGRSSAAIDPATMGPTISIQESRETEMNSILDLLQSRALADEVVRSVGARQLLEKNGWLEVQWENLLLRISALIPAAETRPADIGNSDVTEEQELAAVELMSNLKVSSPKKSTTISVVFRARSPELAKFVAEEVVRCYLKMHTSTTKSEGALSFFENQFSKQNQLLEEAETALRDVKNRAAMLTLDGKKNSLQEEQNTIHQLMIQTRADVAAANQRVDEILAKLEQLPDRIEMEITQGIEAGASDAMRDRLYDLEIKEKELSAKLYDQHPEVKRIRKQLEEARQIMQQQPDAREHRMNAANPVAIEMKKELLLAQANAEALESKLNELQTLDQDVSAKIQEMNALELNSERLQRQIEIAKENHAQYARKLEEARINSALDQEALSNVSVVSAPLAREKPVSPKRTLLCALTLLGSVLAGVVASLSASYQTSVRTNEKTEVPGRATQSEPIVRRDTGESMALPHRPR